jgi:putative DNA primase/helicase
MHGFINGDAPPHLMARVERELPHNIDAERALIGALFVGGHDVLEAVRGRIDAGDMFDVLHEKLWQEISDRIAAGKRVTPTLLNTIDADGKLYAGSLVKDATTTANAPAYADIVRDLAARRRLIAVAQQSIDDAHDHALPLPDVLRSTAAELAIVRGGLASGEAPVIARCVADVEATPIRWLWPQRFACAKVSLIAGEPGVGKSQLTCAMAATVTTGGTWPDKTRSPQGSAILIGCEDDCSDTIRPRLEAAGADLRRVHVLDWVITNTGQKHFDIGQHVGELTALMQRIGDVRLICIDPVSAYMGAADSHVVSEVRQALWPLQAMAAEMGPAVLLVSHLNKGTAANGAMARVAGSGAFVAATRGAWMVGKDPADETKRRRLMVPLKTNIGKDDTEGFAYTVESWQRDDIQTSRIVWEAGTVTVSAEDLLRPAAPHNDGGAVAEAEMFLRTELTDGPKPSSWIDKGAKDAGISKRAIERARKQLGIAATKDSQGRWHISLPPSARKH